MSEEEKSVDLAKLAEHKKNHPTLYLAWQLFARFDKNAKRLKIKVGRLRLAALVLGILAPTFAVTATFFGGDIKNGYSILGEFELSVLHNLILIIPIVVSSLLAASNRLEKGGKWFILRAASERIKREIYSYRVKKAPYNDVNERDITLAKRLEELYEKLMETGVNSIGLQPYNEEIENLPPDIDYFVSEENGLSGDDGFLDMTGQEYVRFRLQSQVDFYAARVLYFHKKMNWLNWLIIIIGALGTFLTAIGLDIWIAVTSSLTAAFTSYMEYHQMEETLTSYNQALATLESIKFWWIALGEKKQQNPENLKKLIDKTEEILNAERLRWIQSMEAVLEDDDKIELDGVGGGEDNKNDSGSSDKEEQPKEEITDGTFTAPTDGPDSADTEDMNEPRDLSPEDLAEISDELEEKYDLNEEDDTKN